MKVAVNTRYLLPDRMEGIARYIFETTKRVVEMNPQHEFHFIFDRPFDKKFVFADNIIPHVVGPPTRHPFLWYLWFEHRLPRFFKKHNIDCFLSGDMYLSLKSNIPTLYISHDLAFHHYPEHLPYWSHKFYNHYAPLYHKKANKIIAVSQATKNDIVNTYGIEASKIRVGHNAAPAGFKALSEDEKTSTRIKYSNGEKYLVYLGSIHPRKNIINLVKAFDLFKTQYDLDTKLLIIGRMAWKNDELKNTLSQLRHKDSIVFPKDFQSDIPKILASSEGLCYISLFEGFGIPILEAFEAGVPVITSKISSMPEVAGDAALLVDPLNLEMISKAMYDLCHDEILRNELLLNAKRQITKFNWNNTARIISDELNTLVEPKYVK